MIRLQKLERQLLQEAADTGLVQAVMPPPGQGRATARLRLANLTTLAACGLLSLAGTHIQGASTVHDFALTRNGRTALAMSPIRRKDPD